MDGDVVMKEREIEESDCETQERRRRTTTSSFIERLRKNERLFVNVREQVS